MRLKDYSTVKRSAFLASTLCLGFLYYCAPAFASDEIAARHDLPSVKSDDQVQADLKIRALLNQQADDWNKGDIEHFVDGYRKSDDVLFVGAAGVKRGWTQILERYKTQYPDRKAMGHLAFSNLEVHLTCPNAAYVIGEFDLELTDKQHRSGYFTLNMIKTEEHWEIVADHTTARQP